MEHDSLAGAAANECGGDFPLTHLASSQRRGMIQIIEFDHA
jgi:hypothetical protein